ncbi:hypothetical protein D7B24_001773 [Verticillium nonalfalfae]|uniref:Uncharacterized protein n=1 Tax=Verticillium nonalfalfae TaxID=1051616 RepID=A0A3M9XZQ5_9PEZI|nr:uncharacterized protein D7B24_001773 [Verticillium nonalfalfae]RNJ53484.1 hypothetical protein D7B24_001773 [Verticillium nonalfalfae]
MVRQKNKKRVQAKDQVVPSETWSADAQQGSTSFFSDGRGDMPLITIHPPSTRYTPPADFAATTSAIDPSSLGPTIPV